MDTLITLTTNLGDQFAIAQLHAMLVSDGFTGRIIENHSVTPFSILEGAFEIDALSRFTPEGAVHVGVVDPGVGSDRRGVPAGSPLALLGSNGTLELAVNLKRADDYFGVQLGDILRIRSFERSDPS